MPLTPRAILFNPIVQTDLQQAWADSNPGATGGHEEGGFVIKDQDGNLSVIRWPQGLQDVIGVPPHANCRVDELEIVATFHTHPNTGSDYLQEPSETDKRAVRDDPDLKASEYAGEFVISQAIIYLVTPAGQVREMDDTQAVFTE
ncbi:MAG: Mov34/MPN/PAD-1 family protein [Chloroflexi bacterium]|nr:Mov34/MPN/PAD-1 family protein [Chloroflexota bacterium]